MNPIQFKRSSVAGKVPGAGVMLVGELAINLVDKKIFTKTANNEVVELSPFVLSTSGAVAKTGDTMTGRLTLNNGLSVTGNSVFSNQIDIGALKVTGTSTLTKAILIGDTTIQGSLTSTGNATFTNPVTIPVPINPQHASTKKYVDDSLATTYKSTGGRIDGNVSWNLETKGVQWGNIIGNATGFSEGAAIYMSSRYPENAPSGSNDHLIFTKSDQNGNSPDGGFVFNWRARSNNTDVKTGEMLHIRPYKFDVYTDSEFMKVVQIGSDAVDQNTQLQVSTTKNWSATFINKNNDSGKHGVQSVVYNDSNYAFSAYDQASSLRFSVTGAGVIKCTSVSTDATSSSVSSSITPRLHDAQVHRYTLTGNTTIANPLLTSGHAGVWFIYLIQGSTGRAVTWGNKYHILQGTISTAANAVNVCQVIADGNGDFDVIINQR